MKVWSGCRSLVRGAATDRDAGRHDLEHPRAGAAPWRHYVAAIGLGVAAYVLVAPVLAVLHELIVLGIAAAFNGFAWAVGSSGLLRTLPLDPIYTSATLLTLGGIQARGLAVVEPIGGLLDGLWPGLFEPPMLVARGALASAVVEPGATVVSRWVSRLAADAALLGIGMLAVGRGLARVRDGAGSRRASWRNGAIAIAGAILQAHVIVGLTVDSPPELHDLEAAGIPFAVAMIVSGDVQAGPRLAERLAELPVPVRGVILGLTAAALAYLSVWLLAFAPRAAREVGRLGLKGTLGFGRLLRSIRRPATWRTRQGQLLGSRGFVRGRVWARFGLDAGRAAVPARWPILFRPTRLPLGRPGRRLATVALAVAIASSPLGELADAETNFLPGGDEGFAAPSEAAPIAPNAAPVAPAEPATPIVAETPNPTPTGAVAPPAPTVVTVSGSRGHFAYTVDGLPQVIRGMGYNVRYRALKLDPELRRQRLDQDLAAIRALGVNTIFGWEQPEFDAELLDVAAAHGLGVAPPFELSPDEDYTDPAIRDRLTGQALDWVRAYKDHPAVRIWAIGNEVLHKLVYPSWMPVRSDPLWEAQARAFARFYVDLIDQVHTLDPYHPIVHRDAEDAYLTWLRDAMADGTPRPWFVYGINSYTPRLAEILAAWPSQNFDVALFVSEFAPGGMGPADRPQGFRSMWRTLRAARSWVLGGSVYAWTTNGPEEVDRVFGLVDGEGRPVDGALAAVRAFYRGEDRAIEGAAEVVEPREGRIWELARTAITTIQVGRGKELLTAEASLNVMGDLSSLSTEPIDDADLRIVRVRDLHRLAWCRTVGIEGEWWATWTPDGEPSQKLTFLIQERSGGSLQVGYIYHGPR